MLHVEEKGKTMKNRVAMVDVNLVKSTQFLYNKACGQFDGLQFMNDSGSDVAICYLERSIICANPSNPEIVIPIYQFIITRVFTGDSYFSPSLFATKAPLQDGSVLE